MSLSVLTDINAHITPSQGVAPIASTGATHTGTGIDRAGTSGDQEYLSGTLAVSVGAATGAPSSFTVDAHLEDSADNSSFAAISPAVAITQMTASGMGTVGFNLKGLRRYVRAVVVTTITGGTSPTLPVAADVILGGAVKLQTP